MSIGIERAWRAVRERSPVSLQSSPYAHNERVGCGADGAGTVVGRPEDRVRRRSQEPSAL